jgi:hypothetical protein
VIAHAIHQFGSRRKNFHFVEKGELRPPISIGTIHLSRLNLPDIDRNLGEIVARGYAATTLVSASVVSASISVTSLYLLCCDQKLIVDCGTVS